MLFRSANGQPDPDFGVTTDGTGAVALHQAEGYNDEADLVALQGSRVLLGGRFDYGGGSGFLESVVYRLNGDLIFADGFQ